MRRETKRGKIVRINDKEQRSKSIQIVVDLKGAKSTKNNLNEKENNRGKKYYSGNRDYDMKKKRRIWTKMSMISYRKERNTQNR